MKNHLKESEERESAKEKEEKENPPPPPPRAPLKDVDNPDKVPAHWNNKMRDWFSFVKDYCRRKNLSGKYSIALIKEWIEYADEIDYTHKGGDSFTKKNFIRSLRLYHARINSVALKKEREAEAGMKLATKKIKEAAMKTPSQIADEQRHKKAAAKNWKNNDWEQCFEECANCIEENGKRRCACGFATPANRRARPIPARECAQFAAKAASPR